MLSALDWCKQSQGKSGFALPLIVQEMGPVKPYPFPGTVFWNGTGKSILRKVEVKTGRVWNNQELVDYFITLHDTPIVFWQDSGCSTCTKLIQAGCEGAEDIAKQVQLVESLTMEVLQQSATQWIDRLLPVLELLSVGYYYITLLDYYPTDGHGNFFWDAFHTLRCWNPFSWDTIEQFQQWDGTGELIQEKPPPCFLVPSQHPVCYSPKALNHARERYTLHPGLALQLQDTAALLLDGHHRATAAAQAGATFRCLTIRSLGAEFHHPFGSELMTSFEKSIQVPKPLLKWNEQLRLDCQKALPVDEYLKQPETQRLWHEAMLDNLSTGSYPWQLPQELGLDQAVSHYPMNYRLNQELLGERMKHFQRQLLSAHIKYDERKTIQGVE